MNIVLKPGVYVVAISGGVDSVTLLHMLTHLQGVKLVVAHFDHGIREDSAMDRSFVASLAKQYGLPFVYEEGRLGPDASEALSRQARYGFLRKVQKHHKATAIITAHHQDDLLETAVLNMLRGTNRKGLSSLRSTQQIMRPLLKVPKYQLIEYAKKHGLTWQEDSTNFDESYLRNYIRHKLMPKLAPLDRAQLLSILGQISALNDTIDGLLIAQLKDHTKANRLDRSWFISLPHPVAREVMAGWLRQYKVNIDRRMLEQTVIAAKTKVAGKQLPINRQLCLAIETHKLALTNLDR